MAVIDNLIGDWELDEANGNALDSHGSNPLTDTNTVGTNGSGWRDFEADNSEYFSHGDNADLSTGHIDFSVETWVQMESKTIDRCIVQKWDGTGTEWIIWYDQFGNFGTADRFGFLIHNGLSVIAAQANNLGSPSLSTPYQIIARVNATTKTISITVNDGTPNTNTYSANVDDTGAGFYIGSNGGTANYWDGLIQRTRFWKKELTDAEVTWLYNSGSGRSYADIVAEAGSAVGYVLVAN